MQRVAPEMLEHAREEGQSLGCDGIEEGPVLPDAGVDDVTAKDEGCTPTVGAHRRQEVGTTPTSGRRIRAAEREFGSDESQEAGTGGWTVVTEVFEHLDRPRPDVSGGVGFTGGEPPDEDGELACHFSFSFSVDCPIL